MVVSVHVLILQLANLIKQNAELVSNVGNVLIAVLAPEGQLLLAAESAIEFG